MYKYKYNLMILCVLYLYLINTYEYIAKIRQLSPNFVNIVETIHAFYMMDKTAHA